MRDSLTYRPRRFWWGVGGAAALDVVGMTALYQFWYRGTDRTAWHWYDRAGGTRWYDDWFTYVQQDKLGHLYGSWVLTRAAAAYGRWSGLSRPRSAVLGITASTLFQAQIEFFDGFSDAYGASRTDLLANLAGSVLGGAQYAYPEALDWFTLKYSYHPSPYYVPSKLLGNGIQDYQGITFWLSLRPERMLPPRAKPLWPDWLAVAVGHSGTGLAHPVSGLNGGVHQRQLFIGPDVVIGELITLPRPVRFLQPVLSFIRLPLPTFQIAPDARMRWFYF